MATENDNGAPTSVQDPSALTGAAPAQTKGKGKGAVTADEEMEDSSMAVDEDEDDDEEDEEAEEVSRKHCPAHCRIRLERTVLTAHPQEAEVGMSIHIWQRIAASATLIHIL
jgi:hypothetical protein